MRKSFILFLFVALGTIFSANAVVPNKVNLKFTTNGSVFHDYEGVKIGEYIWMNKNFHHQLSVPTANPSGGEEVGTENNYVMTEQDLQKYFPCAKLDYSQYKVDLDTFNYYYGQYYCVGSDWYMNKYGQMYEYHDNEIQKGTEWRIPNKLDIQQMFGMCPFNQIGNDRGHIKLNERDVRIALSAHKGCNPVAFNIDDPTGGAYKTYWFFDKAENVNIYGFNLMPGGAKLNGKTSWFNDLHPEGGWPGERGDVYHLFYTAGFRTLENYAYIHDSIDSHRSGWSYHWFNIRWCRALSDTELGYKLYVNANYTDVKKIDMPLGKSSATPPEGYVELPKGYFRGFYVQYILDNPSPKYTLNDIRQFVSLVDDVDKPQMPTGIDNSTTSNLVQLYPIPIQDVLNIKSEATVTAFKLYSLDGQEVYTSHKVDGQVNLNNLSSGVYVAKIFTENGVSTQRVTKQ